MGANIFKKNPDKKEVDSEGNVLHVEEENNEMKFAIWAISSHSIGRVELPMGVIDEINEHIDNVIIPKHDDF